MLTINSAAVSETTRTSTPPGTAIRLCARKNKTVVFYTLPMVIRERPTLFSSIVDLYRPLAEQFAADGWDCVFVGSDELRHEFPCPAHQWLSPSSLDCAYPDWKQAQWLPAWTSILDGRPPAFHQVFVNQVIEQTQPDLVFCWNHDSALQAACNEQDITLIYNELGMLRAPNPLAYFSDKTGVNARSAFRSQCDHFLKGVGARDLGTHIDRLQALEALYPPPTQRPPAGILILLQVRDDSNALIGSPFSSMSQYVQCVLDAVADSGMEIIIKPHPLDEVPDLPANVQLAGKSDPIADLIGASQVVFTINSSAGFEAALAGKTVYVMGRAAYCGLGLTVDVATPDDLPQAWATHQARFTGSQALRAQVLHFAESRYFLSEAQFKDPTAHLARLAENQPGRGQKARYQTELENYRLRARAAGVARDNQRLRAEHAALGDALSRSTDERLRMENSRSWRVTRPLRNLLSFWASLKGRLRTLYQSFPLLLVLRVRAAGLVKSIQARVLSTVNSTHNLKSLQALADRRFTCPLPATLPVADSPVIDVSVVTYNSSKWVDGFFRSLTEQSYPLGKLRLCFVDNGSSDTTVEKLHAWRATLADQAGGFAIIQGENVGFGLGHHRAIQRGTADYVLVSNIDITFAAQALHNIVNAARADVDASVASWEMRQAPYEHPKYYDPVTLEVNWSSHACILLRRTAYQRVGGYEPKIFMYGEDVELSYRFRAYGYRLKYCPSALVQHYTYEHHAQVKPLQYQGSTLANACIRWRYGDITDRFAAILLQAMLLFRPNPYKHARRDVVKNLAKLCKNLPHFSALNDLQKEQYFPFRGFDYDATRDGAFWPTGQPMAEYPLVSVITRTYKGREEFLRQAILSVMNQTYPHIELIVVEDGGVTMEPVVSRFSSVTGKNIRFFGLDKVGRSVTGNHGLDQASGKYCLFLDDDDLLFADHIEVLVAALLENPDSVAAYSLAMEVGTDPGSAGRYVELSHEVPSAFKHAFDYNTLLDHNFIPIQSLLFERALFLARGGFETDMDHLEDWNLWLRYGFDNTFSYVPKTTSLFRTPADLGVRLARQLQLHEAYATAKQRAADACQHYRHASCLSELTTHRSSGTSGR